MVGRDPGAGPGTFRTRQFCGTVAVDAPMSAEGREEAEPPTVTIELTD
jgi:hypothetical protein